MINREATVRWKGYDPADLKPQSHKRVWAICETYGKEYEFWGQYFDIANGVGM